MTPGIESRTRLKRFDRYRNRGARWLGETF